jgi:hypothetical protein
MRVAWRMVLVLPTWGLVRLMLAPRLAKTHPWYGRRFSLRDWAIGATPLTIKMSAMLWVVLPFYAWAFGALFVRTVALLLAGG